MNTTAFCSAHMRGRYRKAHAPGTQKHREQQNTEPVASTIFIYFLIFFFGVPALNIYHTLLRVITFSLKNLITYTFCPLHRIHSPCGCLQIQFIISAIYSILLGIALNWSRWGYLIATV